MEPSPKYTFKIALQRLYPLFQKKIKKNKHIHFIYNTRIHCKKAYNKNRKIYVQYKL